MPQKLYSIFMFIVYGILHVFTMILIMSMNFYIIISIILGAIVGYFVSSQDYSPKKTIHDCCEGKERANKQ
jgi:hypothetical protein